MEVLIFITVMLAILSVGLGLLRLDESIKSAFDKPGSGWPHILDNVRFLSQLILTCCSPTLFYIFGFNYWWIDSKVIMSFYESIILGPIIIQIVFIPTLIIGIRDHIIDEFKTNKQTATPTQ